MNTNQPFRLRHGLKLAAILVVVGAVSALSSANVRGAVRHAQVRTLLPALAKLALNPITEFMQGPVAGQGDQRTVPGAQAKPGAPAEPPAGDGMVSLLVKTRQGLSDEAVDAMATRAGGKRGRGIGALRLHVIRVPQAALDGVMHRFQEDPDVERVEVEQRRQIAQDALAPASPNDPGHADQWALDTIRWNAAWSSVTPVGSARIAVLDTGVSTAGGDINVVDGWSAFGTDPKTDPNGHGTWVASIAAAVGNNDKGIAGVSFSNTSVMPVQVLDANGQGQDGDIISGVLWAVENNADVILMAFSNPGYSQALQDAIDLAWANGIVVVAAVGNEASSTPTFPAGDSKVVGVAATDQADSLWSQSNYGKAAFLAAPGVSVPGLRPDGSVLSTSGTSAASAMVAGAAALLKMVDPSASNGVIVGRLARNADPAGTQEQTGNGRVNIERALTDVSLEEVVPVGAPPEGDGGPFVGPYNIAAATVNSATLNGAATVTVTTGATISAAVTVTSQNANGNNRVGSIGWRIATTTPGPISCVDVTDVQGANGQPLTATRTFSITAPGTAGTYNAYFIAYSDNSCTNNPSGPLSLTNAVVVTPANTAPTAVNDTYTTDEDTVLTVAAPGVLSNDTDPDASDTRTTVLVAGPTPAQGTLTLNQDGSFTFTPASNFNGTASFTYKAKDTAGSESNTATVTITVNPVNDAPVAVNDSYSTDEDVVLTVPAPGVLTNDTDVDAGDTRTSVLVTSPTTEQGTLTLNANGSFTFTPASNFNGPVTFTYKAKDAGGLESSAATVTITVTAVNDAPVSVNDSYSANEDAALTVPAPGVLSNDTDGDTGDTRTSLLVAGPTAAQGTLLLNADGSFTFTPASNFNGTATFTYKAKDAAGSESSAATVTITVNAVNDKPTAAANPASLSIDEDAAATPVQLSGTDVETAAIDLKFVILELPANGVLTKDGSPLAAGSTLLGSPLSVAYMPNANYSGSDTFKFKVKDTGDPAGCIGGPPACAANSDSNEVAVTITVNPVNDAPDAKDDAVTTAEDTPAAVTVLTNDTDVDGDTLSVTAVTQGANGTVTFTATGVTYTPNPNFHGSDSFTYTVSDGTLTDTATVAMTVTPVNDAPVATDDSATTLEDTAAPVAVLTNDTDVDGDSLSVTAVAQGAHGTVTFTATGVTYTPNANFHGSDSFTYTVSDGTLTDTATVAITVTPVNDAPVAANDSYTATEDTLLTIAAPGVLGNDMDPDTGDASTALLVAGPAHGTLALNANGSFNYTPAANYCGADSFSYKANDGEADSNVATVTLDVTCVNDAPVAANDSYTATEDTLLTIAAPGVLGNDTDPDSGDLSTAVVVTGPAHGTLGLNANGSFNYTPAANYCGADGFSYKANDGEADSNVATVTLDVTCVNDAPVAANDSYTATEDTLLAIAAPGVLGNDTDPDSADSSTALAVSNPAHGTLALNADGSFNYTPAANYCGADSFSYKANDGEADSNVATVTLDVACVNDAPVAASDSYTATEDTLLTIAAPGVLGNDTDPDTGDASTALVVGNPVHGTLALSADGSFNYTPAANYCGADSFSYKANDGEADSNVATVTLDVTCVNDAPDAKDDAATTPEDTPATVTVLTNDTDVDGDTLAVTAVTQGANGTVALTATSVTYTPGANFHGTDSFTYTLSDGTLADTATVAITVTPVNDAPVAANDSYTATEDTLLTIAAPGVLGNDTDVDSGDASTAIVVSNPAHGTLSLSADGSFSYTPTANYCGADSFSYKANDGEADSNVATVTFDVKCVNDAPVAANDSYTAIEDTLLTIAAPGVLGNDTDPDTGDTSTALVVAGPAHGTLALNADGSFSYTPTANYCGADSFSYRANDGEAASNVATVLLNVTCVNDTPANVSVSVTPGAINENQSSTASGSFTDPDATDGHKVTIKWGDGSADTVLTLAPGVFTFSAPHHYLDDKPSATASDNNSVIVTVEDATSSGTGATQVTVNNLAPIVGPVAGPIDPVALGASITVSAPFTDGGTLDTHSCLVNWGTMPASSSAGTVSEAGGSGSCSAMKTYAAAGVYTVTVTITDDDTGVHSNSTTQMLVIYDPNGGFVTGGGFFNSPAGAAVLFPEAVGRANFGFVSKYAKGAKVPTGETEFQFKAGNLNFHSSFYEWLVVGGARAQYKGEGTINGAGRYGFLLTVVDGQVTGGGGTDKFRIKIWDKNNGDAIVYNNEMTSTDDAPATTVIAGGSIVIHEGRK